MPEADFRNGVNETTARLNLQRKEAEKTSPLWAVRLETDGEKFRREASKAPTAS